jgi:hypothetical protein
MSVGDGGCEHVRVRAETYCPGAYIGMFRCGHGGNICGRVGEDVEVGAGCDTERMI